MLGVICRADMSGLASQGQAIARLTAADKVLAVTMGPLSRGAERLPTDLPGQITALDGRQALSRDHARHAARFLNGCDTIWTPEGWPWTQLVPLLTKQGARTCVTVNPELYRPCGATAPALPTTWHQAALGLPVVPHPTPHHEPAWAAVRRDNEARGGPARTVLHIAAPAMLDRNGTDPLLGGLASYVGPAFTLRVAGAGLDQPTRGRPQAGLSLPGKTGTERQVRVVRMVEVADRLDLYRGVDLLVLPRRYAGLSLPAQEAAAAGVPVLMTDLSPQDEWSGVDASIRCGRGTVERMRGGRFRVAAPDPESVRRRVQAYTSDDGTVREGAQLDAVAWSLAGSWPHVSGMWDEWLACR